MIPLRIFTNQRKMKDVTAYLLKKGNPMTLSKLLGIKVKTISASEVTLSLAITEQLKQPYGLLHGGINAVLAEHAASLGANAVLKEKGLNQVSVGTDLQIHHLASAHDGTLSVMASPLKTGHRLQVWQVKIYHLPDNVLTAFATVTLTNQTQRPAR